MTAVYIDSFSEGLDDLKRKQQADFVFVLKFLAQAKRFSIFEATANMVIARTLTRLLNKSLTQVAKDGTKTAFGVLLKSTGGAYPWTNVELTEGGVKFLAGHADLQ